MKNILTAIVIVFICFTCAIGQLDELGELIANILSILSNRRSVEILGHTCYMSNSYYLLDEPNLQFRARFYCPKWTDIDGRGYGSNAISASLAALDTFFKKSIKAGLVTEEDIRLENLLY